MHGGFAAGLVVLAFTFLIEAGFGFFVPEQRQKAYDRCRWLIVLGLGAGAATLVNPYGYGLHLWIFRTLRHPTIMNLNLDWLSPDFHESGSFRVEGLILLFPLLLAVSRRRANPVALGLSLLWLHFALNGRRYVPVWVLVATPLLARLSAETVCVERLGAFLAGRYRSPGPCAQRLPLANRASAGGPAVQPRVLCLLALGGLRPAHAGHGSRGRARQAP